ncbi:MAG: hypothetical protein JW820_18595 [Spirochaetales bacterium]|nr:hypothetical protein [Spirochaetales bacterium]
MTDERKKERQPKKSGTSVNRPPKFPPEVTKLAALILADDKETKTARALAGSILSQSGAGRQTGARLGSLASKVMKSTKYSEDTKTLAGSVLAQPIKTH